MHQERREAARVPVGFYVQQMIDDTPVRCFATDLSSTGLYLERVLTPVRRSSSIVQLEMPLPGTSDTLWAKAEVVYDCFDQLFHGSALQITGIAAKHERLLRDWLTEVVVDRTAAAHELMVADFGRKQIERPRPMVLSSPQRRYAPRRRSRKKSCRGLWQG